MGGINHYQYVPNPIGWVDPLGLTAQKESAARQLSAVASPQRQTMPPVTPNADSIIYVDSHSLAIQGNKHSVYRANAVTPDIDESISKHGFLTGKARGVIQSEDGALPNNAPMQNRIIQYVEGRPFPRDADFVGFKKVPHDALNTAIRTGRQTMKQDGASLRLDEVNINNLDPIDVEKIYRDLGRAPREPLDVVGEFVVEGSVPASNIVKTKKLSRDDINNIKKVRKR